MSEEKQGLRRNFGIQKWIETYCTTFWVNEPPFTSHFGVHQRTWFLTQNHIATTATASLWSLLLDPILVVAKKTHPQEDVLRIFVGLLQPSLNGTDNVVQGICPAP
jgi:hypothetical protein